MAEPWRSSLQWHTGLSADSVEWCPVDPHTDLLACGTYQLTEQDGAQTIGQKRIGKIYLFKINREDSSLNPIDTIETSGVLDQKWSHFKIGGKIILAIVTSAGYLQLYEIVEKDNLIKLRLRCQEIIVQNGLALSLDWSSNRDGLDPKVVVSDSNGFVTVVRVGDQLEVLGVWNGHRFEAWIGAFDYWNTNVFYSGGDDSIFKSYDIRIANAAVTSSNRCHDAGVTSIRSHTVKEHTLLTGSYDENIRLWDPRNLKASKSEINVNGGVWRLKWHPKKHDTILVACMYGGFKIIQLCNEKFNKKMENLEHESIAYGADWKFGNDEKACVATCSFYDCKLCISYVDL